MLIGHGALEPAPRHAQVPEHIVLAVARELGQLAARQSRLDREFHRLEAEQPALADLLANELSDLADPIAQELAYHLFLTTCAAFREAFGARLGPVDESELDGAIETLLADGEVRSQTCRAGSYSQDVVALWQPALMRLVHEEIEDADAGAQLDPVLQVLLVLIVALTRAVAAE